MATFVMLTRLSPEAVADPRAFEQLSQQVTEKIKAQCPEVKWLGNYAVLGPYDGDKSRCDHPLFRACHHRDLGCNALGALPRAGAHDLLNVRPRRALRH